MDTNLAVVGIVKFENKLLLLKRNLERHCAPNKWEFVSGSVKEWECGEKAVLREVKEETGFDGEVVRAGKVFEVLDDWGRWVIIPFLISVNSDKVRIDPKEHLEYKWINPQDTDKFNCVAGIKEDLRAVGIL
jgi:8-oxo-dGTP diphosphatase